MLDRQATRNVTLEDIFNSFIKLIENGNIYSGYPDNARHMAERCNFPIERVDKAIQTGYEGKFRGYVGLIGQGATHLEHPARRLLEEVTFRDPEIALGELEAALELGKIEERKYI